MKSHALVLFDIDGTLISRAGPHHKSALIEGIRRVTGIATTLDGVATQGMLDCDLITGMLQAGGVSRRRIRTALQDIMAECQSAYLSNCLDDLRDRVCPGIPQLLERLKTGGATIGVVTGNLSRIGWKKLELAGIRDYFSLGAFAEDGSTRIRLAAIAASRARKDGLVRRDCRISLLGDHPNDVAAAKGNSFFAVAVATGMSSLEELKAAQPDLAVKDAGEIDAERHLLGL